MKPINTTFKINPGILVALKSVGVDVAVVLRKCGLPLNFFSTGQAVINTEQFFAMWHAMKECSDDPALGLKLPGLIPVDQLHPVSIAAHHARTFRDAIQRMARYKILCCAEEMRLVETKTEGSVEFNWVLSSDPTPPLLLDCVFAGSMEMARRGTGLVVHPLRVELRRKSEHREIYENHFGCTVKFKAQRNAIVYRTSDLDRPFLTYNAQLLALLSPQFDEELARRRAEQSVTARVKWVLKRLLGGHRPELTDVARELGMSCRTLQRRITEERTSFRQLFSDARRELARQYLLQPSLQLTETACLLGYEDPNSFFRAFREWEGTTPGEWRTRQGQNEQSI